MSHNLPIPQNSQLKITSRKLPHWELNGSIYHITFVTWERLELNESAREIVLNSCLFFHLKRYEIFAMVIMPDHVHLLIQPWAKSDHDGRGVNRRPACSTDDEGEVNLINHRRDACSTEYWSLSSIMHSIKSFTGKQITKVMKHIGTVWEDESHDHIIRNYQEFQDTWQYIRQNPVQAGLSVNPEAYSFLWESEKSSEYS
ncbi:transposase [Cylindrospermum sp. FACHB-282]|uniref:transposase n=1 Tax=Cylindrospermum sp. FACHB-282 TaxID=2692794 RepID=UPI0016882A95|nr:transposase [Cylindrospermum sp. FACHB-282]MBD2387062.1 transposase [Cylindrospermum sp. FACHB-282]